MTSCSSLETDIGNAGGIWVDGERVVCSSGRHALVNSRKPDDLPDFCAQTVEELAGASTLASA